MSIYRYALPKQSKSKTMPKKEGLGAIAPIAFRVASTNSFSLNAGFWVQQN
jgi:hypothetical protein